MVITINEFVHYLNSHGVFHKGKVFSKDKYNYVYCNGARDYLTNISSLYDYYTTYPEEFIFTDKRSKRYVEL